MKQEHKTKRYIVDLDGSVKVFDGNPEIPKYTRLFKTKEEALFEAEKMKFLRKLEKYATDYDEKNENYFLNAGRGRTNEWVVDYDLQILSTWVEKHHGLCFDSEDTIEKVIKIFGEKDILKYYFNIY